MPQILLAVIFLLTGGMKLFTPFMGLAENMVWVEDFTAFQIKAIGLLEVLGALGLLIPFLLKKYRLFIPLSALGLAFTMVGAAIVHIGRGEPLVPNIVLFILAVFVFITRRAYLSKA
ncbi:MAG: DoxX family protein [Bacteroidales bacterium]|nr:DoxX family protein [Bacteroidales bacterium]MCF8403141.1 DoxX family protein [Bacteroidales bacterium]